MSEPVIIISQCTEDEYVAAVRLWNSRRTNSVFFLYLSAFVALIGILIIALSRETLVGAIFTAIGLTSFAYLFNALFRLPRRFYKTTPGTHASYRCEFSNEDILFQTEDSESRIQWSAISGYWETDDFYFFIRGGQLFTFLPKRAFNSAQQIKFKNLLEGKKIEPIRANRWIESKREAPKIKEYTPPQTPPDWRQED